MRTSAIEDYLAKVAARAAADEAWLGDLASASPEDLATAANVLEDVANCYLDLADRAACRRAASASTRTRDHALQAGSRH